MYVRVRAPNRSTSRVDVDGDTFSSVYNSVATKFAINGSFELYLGDNLLPNSDERIATSNLGVVNGDLLKLVASSFSVPEEKTEVRSKMAKVTETKAEAESAANTESAKSFSEQEFIDTIVNEMQKSGFSIVNRSAGGLRLEFKHAGNGLAVVELDLRLFSEFGKHRMQVLASIVSPVQRVFLDPAIVVWGVQGIHQFIADEVVTPIREKVLGNDNLLLRTLAMKGISEIVLRELDVRSLVRFECTCRTAREMCTSSRSDELWKHLLLTDFRGPEPRAGETYRMCYKRHFEEAKKRRDRRDEFGPFASEIPNFPYPTRPFPTPDARPYPRPDPDLPVGPLGNPHPDFPSAPWPYQPPDPDFPFGPVGGSQPANPFHPAVPRFPRGAPNPLDPFSGSEILPSRPRHPRGLPRQFPDRSDFGGGFI